MDRGSDKVSPREDEQRKHEVEGLIRSGRTTHAEEWKDPEPIGEDQPDADLARRAAQPTQLPRLRRNHLSGPRHPRPGGAVPSEYRPAGVAGGPGVVQCEMIAAF